MKGLRTRTSKYTPEQRSERRRKRNILKKEIYDRQQSRQLAFFVAIEEKTIRLEKKKNEAAIRQIQKIKNTLFPNNLLQERYDNFIPYYLNYGENLFKILKNNFDPLHPNFVILRI